MIVQPQPTFLGATWQVRDSTALIHWAEIVADSFTYTKFLATSTREYVSTSKLHLSLFWLE